MKKYLHKNDPKPLKEKNDICYINSSTKFNMYKNNKIWNKSFPENPFELFDKISHFLLSV